MTEEKPISDDERKLGILIETKDLMLENLNKAKTSAIRSTIDIKNLNSILAGLHDDIMHLQRKGIKLPEKPVKKEETKEV